MTYTVVFTYLPEGGGLPRLWYETHDATHGAAAAVELTYRAPKGRITDVLVFPGEITDLDVSSIIDVTA